ncbi:MAG: hypothetical protein GQ551_11375 [Myxococcales bacterium]|nr:hypothetical protein [Myxococcales bacterium]
MGRLSWLGALVGVLALHAGVPHVLAQDELAQDASEVEVITEPPPQLESPPPEPPAEQPPPEPEKPEEPLGHLRVGGGIGFGFGSNFISIGISPQVSYIFKRIVEPGVALRYQYTKDSLPVRDITWHTYGGSLFVRVFPIQQFFIIVEGEIINTGWKQAGFSSGRRNYGNLLLGGGFVIGVGKGAFVATSLKIPIFRNAFYPDAFPIISIGGGYAF